MAELVPSSPVPGPDHPIAPIPKLPGHGGSIAPPTGSPGRRALQAGGASAMPVASPSEVSKLGLSEAQAASDGTSGAAASEPARPGPPRFLKLPVPGPPAFPEQTAAVYRRVRQRRRVLLVAGRDSGRPRPWTRNTYFGVNVIVAVAS